MKNLYNRDKKPVNIDELYKNSCSILVTHKIDHNFCLYGNPCSPEVIEISNWESFIIRDRNQTFRIEIPKYAPFNHN